MLRQEIPEDYREVEALVYDAFESSNLVKFEEVTEHKIVKNLRNSGGFIPELSIVAQEGWEIVGHILLTKVLLQGVDDTKDILALAPMSVKPILQKTGVGLQLIMESTDKAIELGYGAIVVVGHKDYYPKFGFKPASDYSITISIKDIPSEYIFIKELKKDYLKDFAGEVIYPEAFM